jgi:hypothetical protein
MHREVQTDVPRLVAAAAAELSWWQGLVTSILGEHFRQDKTDDASSLVWWFVKVTTDDTFSDPPPSCDMDKIVDLLAGASLPIESFIRLSRAWAAIRLADALVVHRRLQRSAAKSKVEIDAMLVAEQKLEETLEFAQDSREILQKDAFPEPIMPWSMYQDIPVIRVPGRRTLAFEELLVPA